MNNRRINFIEHFLKQKVGKKIEIWLLDLVGCFKVEEKQQQMHINELEHSYLTPTSTKISSSSSSSSAPDILCSSSRGVSPAQMRYSVDILSSEFWICPPGSPSSWMCPENLQREIEKTMLPTIPLTPPRTACPSHVTLHRRSRTKTKRHLNSLARGRNTHPHKVDGDSF